MAPHRRVDAQPPVGRPANGTVVATRWEARQSQTERSVVGRVEGAGGRRVVAVRMAGGKKVKVVGVGCGC